MPATTHSPSPPTASRLEAGRRAFVAVAAAALCGCTSFPHSPEQMMPVQRPVLDATQADVQDSSGALAETQDRLQGGINRAGPPADARPAAPADDPMLKKVVTIDMRDAKIGPLLWLLASEVGFSLSVEPKALQLPSVANLHLQRVTGRQALDRILATFDVHGNLGADGVLSVTLMEERIFDTELLLGRLQLQLNNGGDALGNSSKDGGSGLKDVAVLTGEFGEKGDGMESLLKSLDSILADPRGDKAGNPARYSVDRTSGLLFVSARPSKMRLVESLIERGRQFRDRMVQIDAQLVDVQLTDGSSVGIDWNLLARNIAGRVGTVPGTTTGIGQLLNSPPQLDGRLVTLPSQSFGGNGTSAGGGLLLGSNAFSLAISALRSFGTVKVLSNPSVRLRNGVPAYLSVGDSIRYVQKVTSQVTQGAGSSVVSTNVETDAVFSGVVIGVNAVVRADGSLELFVKPSQTQVQPLSLTPVDVGSGNKVTLPIVNIKTMATTLNMRSGDTVLIGGLLDQHLNSTNSGVPGLADMPRVGGLFDNAAKGHSTQELVMVLRARVLSTADLRR